MAVASFNGCDDVRLRCGVKVAGAKRKTQTQQSNRGGGWRRLATDVNGDNRWRQAAIATGGRGRGSGSGTFGGSGGRRLQW